ncbi:MAG: tail fiber protein, partial [Burkholderiaceae bacterium]|nr:tail fiber protein [Burkholderiaceae bacterium]
MQIKHNFISAKADGSDASLIRPSNWNEDHVITMATGKVLGRVTAGDGTAEEVDWTAFGRSLINLADVPALRDLLGGVHIGEFKAFAMSSLPSGWLNCNGAAVSRTTYSALFAAIGTVWGAGNGTTTFNVPDL